LPQARRRNTQQRHLGPQVFRHLHHSLRESGLLLCAGVAVYLFIALASRDPRDPGWSQHSGGVVEHNLAGVAGAWFADISFYFVGYMAYLLPLAVAFAGWRLFRREGMKALDAELVLLRGLGFVVTMVAACGLVYLYLGRGDNTGGGVVGHWVAESLVTAFGALGGGLFLLALFMAGFNLASGMPWLQVFEAVGRLVWDGMGLIGKVLMDGSELCFRHTRRLAPLLGEVWSWREARSPAAEVTPDEATESESPARRRRQSRVEPVVNPAGAEVQAELFPALIKTPPKTAKPRPPKSEQPMPGLPPLDLLDLVPAGQTGYADEVLEEMSRQLETLLAHFGVEVRVVAVEPGPVITRFELEPAPGVKVSQISNLVKDLARGLSVIAVRVVEVIPGKSVVGLEIPNQDREVVYLSEVLDSAAYARTTSATTLAMGKDIGGKPVVADLTRMPHLLVAGTTGSGKSVAINAMLLSMLYKADAEELRLILIDPKMLELSVYEGIPHLLAPVVTDMKEAANALRWCVAEMERRYRLLAAVKVRNITGYNRKVQDALDAGTPLPDPLYQPEPGAEDPSPPALGPLPYIVVVIDELADMMMVVGKKVEELIARLAQKARASGIHLILATQRPSVDVITGLIKANIPTRVAFQVSSRTDSRTILDQMGAEQLLGHGDMLYLPPGTGTPQRLHGAFVADHEVHRVVEFLKNTGEPEYLDEVTAIDGTGGMDIPLPGLDSADSEADPLYDEAVRIVTETRRASISGVQRRLKIGYNRAARMIEEMEQAGIVGTLEANGAREVLAPPPPEA